MAALAGVLYSAAGFIVLMGIITAETTYPVWRHYSTRQEISDLGATRPPHSVVTQPAATVFDVTMIVAGVLLLLAAWAAWHHFRHPVLLVVSALFGTGVLLVGIFPGNTGPHPLVALAAFVFAALTPVTTFKLTDAPFRWMSLAVGLLSLAALVVGELGDHGAVARVIGTGGVERWVVYPIVLWLPFFGGRLLADNTRGVRSKTRSSATSDRRPVKAAEEAAEEAAA